jgi:exodeoxyribonuclease-3
MRILSWNVNGYRAALGKGFLDWLAASGADVAMLQETKVEPEQLAPAERDPAGYAGIWNWSKGKKGYSGTACFVKTPPLAHSFGLEDPRYRA